jgi:hypothetical protein
VTFPEIKKLLLLIAKPKLFVKLIGHANSMLVDVAEFTTKANVLELIAIVTALPETLYPTVALAS